MQALRKLAWEPRSDAINTRAALRLAGWQRVIGVPPESNDVQEQTSHTAAIRALPSATSPAMSWRTPTIIVLSGCLIAMLSFGPRASLGFFLTPQSQANGWGRDVFGFALAIQNIVWGLGQPIAGMLADRFGIVRVLCVGAICYAIGLVMMAYATTPLILDISAGMFIGFGLAGSSFGIVLAALGKLLPERWRGLAFGAGTAAGSFGQFLYAPVAVSLIDAIGWQQTLITFGVVMLLVLPLSFALATRGSGQGSSGVQQSLGQALSEALGQRSYVLLVIGYFTCGFQLAFITIHLPAYLVDRGLSTEVGGWTIAVIGLFNIVGSLTAGWLSNLMPKRYILSFIYFFRALAVLAFISFPVTAVSAIVFGAVMGFLWLSTVAPTNAIIALIFGTRWLATLSGLAFFSHQVGGFLGVWLGGFVFERSGSYDAVWWLSVLFGLLSAVINLPIVEKPIARPAPAAA
jgi:MFS family permease